ncbi:hypothetical protein HDZ31DRAFT_68198 [Schizophyllum fasciatum]
MGVVLRVWGESLAGPSAAPAWGARVPLGAAGDADEAQELRAALAELREVQARESERLLGLVAASLGTLSFIRETLGVQTLLDAPHWQHQLIDFDFCSTYDGRNANAIATVLVTISRLHNLERLSVKLERAHGGSYVREPSFLIPSGEPALLQKLSWLSISCDDCVLTPLLLDRLKAPHLAEIEYNTRRHENIEPFAEFLSRLEAPLKSLPLGIRRWHRKYDKCLRITPSLEHLVVTGLNPYIAKSVQLNRVTPKLDYDPCLDMCPRLRSVEFWDVWGIGGEWLLDFLLTHALHDVALQSVIVRFGYQPSDSLEKQTKPYTDRGTKVTLLW